MSERTEAPTPQRLQEARERGQIPHSVELNAAIGMLVGLWMLQGPGSSLITSVTVLMRYYLTNLPYEITPTWLKDHLFQDVMTLAPSLAQIVLGLMVASVVVTVVQTGGITWASKRSFFDFNRVNLVNGIKRLFSLQGVADLVKSLLKLGVVGYVAYNYLYENFGMILHFASTDLPSAVQNWVSLGVGLVTRVGGAYFVVAAADFIYQRWQFTRNLRMTKQEIIEESKRSEGDPFLKSRIRQQQRRMAQARMMSAVPKADVVVTNPTHLAIAIKYDAQSMGAPRVLAKGSNYIAQKIKEVAAENNVPCVENVPLAHAIYKVVDIDQEIPPELYVAMAEILAYVYKMRQQQARPALV
jgi:flagellar biosynthetic protein FlhB